MDRAHRKCYPHHKWPCTSIIAINSTISSSNNFMPEDCFKSGPCNLAIRNLSCQFCLFCPFGWITATESTTQQHQQQQPTPQQQQQIQRRRTSINHQYYYFATVKYNQQFYRRLLYISFNRCDASLLQHFNTTAKGQPKRSKLIIRIVINTLNINKNQQQTTNKQTSDVSKQQQQQITRCIIIVI